MGPNKKMLIRTSILGVLFILCLVIIVPAALVQKQIINYDFYQEKAVNQQTTDKIIEPERGTIFDRNMKELAVSANVEQVTADPKVLASNDQDVLLIAGGLSEILDVDYEETKEKLKKDVSYVVIKSEVEKNIADLVREFVSENNIKGISLVPDTKRYYPQGTLASNLIGFTGTDGYGLEGIEAYYNDTLSGTVGRIITAKDSAGNKMSFEYEQIIEAQNGNSIVLTIDEVIQYFLEKNLQTAVEENMPLEGASGIIMDVKTGEILAMATSPTYNPNEPFDIVDYALGQRLLDLVGDELTAERRKVYDTMWRNKPVVDSYEPGSTFKIFTVAMALEEGVISPESTFFCPGYQIVAGETINCHKAGGHGTQTLSQALQNSCNPAMMQIAALVGSTKYMEYVKAFGLTEKTGIDLWGETSGIFHRASSFNEVELAVSAFGQTFQVTPLQMISGVSAIVNDGYLVEPHVVKQVVDDDGMLVSETSVETVSQVVSKETSDLMKSMLEEVVTVGTARNAYVAGYRVGGKTATSEKVTLQLATGERHYIASFIGVAPMDDPQIAVLIMIDEPQGESHMGGAIAAPVVGRIMADVLPYIGVTPEYTEEEMASIDISAPNIIGMTTEQAEINLKSQNLGYRIIGDGDKVLDQVPAPSSSVPSSATIILYTDDSKPKDVITVPNVDGMTVSKAKETLEKLGLFVRASGASAKISGTVSTKASNQSPKAGTEVYIGTVINVEFTDSTNVSD